MSSISEELAEQIRAIREEVVMKTLSVTLLAGGVLLVGNMARNLHLGNSLSIIHPLLYLSLFSVFLLRRRIGAARIAWFTVILLYLAATVGLFIYGLAGIRRRSTWLSASFRPLSSAFAAASWRRCSASAASPWSASCTWAA